MAFSEEQKFLVDDDGNFAKWLRHGPLAKVSELFGINRSNLGQAHSLVKLNGENNDR